jgi:hypothetical protein
MTRNGIHVMTELCPTTKIGHTAVPLIRYVMRRPSMPHPLLRYCQPSLRGKERMLIKRARPREVPRDSGCRNVLRSFIGKMRHGRAPHPFALIGGRVISPAMVCPKDRAGITRENRSFARCLRSQLPS